MRADESRTRRVVPLLVLLLVVGGTGAGTYLLLRSPSAAPGPGVSGNLSVVLPRPTAVLDAEFWGVNVVPLSAPTPGVSQGVLGSPATFVRYPGGLVGERYNLSSNTLYNDSGTPHFPPFGLPQFVPWCATVHCHAILELPAEIDSPSTAAYEVAYTENVVGFHPSYWEIGNEPATWNHFGIPWSRWNASQNLNATPATFAALVGAYAVAIHRVDPSAQVIGLGGVGTGAENEAVWLRAVARADGPDLAGLAIHVYPASGGPVGAPGGLGPFFSTLFGPSSLTQRYPIDLATIRGACASCGTLRLFVTELGSVNGTGNYAADVLNGPAQASYLAAQVIQAAEVNITQLDSYALESSYPAAWFDPSGNPRPVGVLYDAFLSQLGMDVYATHCAGGPPGVLAAAFSRPTGGGVSLLVVDANASSGLDLSPSVAGLSWSGSASVTVWGPAGAAPVRADAMLRSGLAVPAGGVLLVTDAGAVAAALGPSVPTRTGLYAPLTVTSVSVPLIPGILRIRWTTVSSASLMCSAWSFTMRSKGPVTASTSTTLGTWRMRRMTSSSRPTSVSTKR